MTRKPDTDFPTREERLKAATDRLEAGIGALFTSDRYATYLQAMSKFHRYSYGNVLMILLQCPHASQVAGFHTWKKEFGRTVKKGAKGIQILFPCTYTKREEQENTDPDSEQSGKKTVTGYKVGYVFDVSQTEGREMPSLNCELSGDVEQYEAVRAALEGLSPAPVRFAPLPGESKGSYSHVDRSITVRPGMSQVQTIKTLIHEIAHAKLHALPVENGIVSGLPEKDKSTREVEAESTAYVVCQHFGIDTSEYTFGYVAGWSRGRELTELKSSLSVIRATAAEIIGGIEAKCPELAPPEPEREETPPGPVRSHKGRRLVPAR